MQNALQMGLPLHRGSVGEPGGGSFAGTFERKQKYIWVPFLDPEVINTLRAGDAICVFNTVNLGTSASSP